MAFDGYSYLVSQGWSGLGSGLRQGSISKPLFLRQRKGQGGVGVDRDDATPFWDHIFTATAQSIHIDISKDSDDDTEEEESTNRKAKLKKVDGSADPDALKFSNSCLDVSLPSIMSLGTHKRNAARKELYAKFSQGPTLGPSTTTLEDNPAEDRPNSHSTCVTFRHMKSGPGATKSYKKEKVVGRESPLPKKRSKKKRRKQ